MISRRIKESLGLLMIGDGLLCAIFPRKHVELWDGGGPGACSKAMRMFGERPGLTRSLGAVGVGLGLWLAHRQYGIAEQGKSVAQGLKGRVKELVGAG